MTGLAFAIVMLSRVAIAAQPLPPVQTVAEGRERLRYLKEEFVQVERWVEENWEAEFASRHPDLARRPKIPKETPQSARERAMRVRMAISDLKRGMRAERREWLRRELVALLSQDIREDLPVRLGPYDPDRGEYPLLFGFGWPSGLIVRMKVPEREKAIFAARFPKAFPVRLRLNEKGEVTLLSLERGNREKETTVYLAPPGPTLLWQGSHESWVTSVACRPDGSQALSAGADGMLVAWDVETGNRVWRREDVEMALSLAYSPDGSSFVTGGTDSYLRMRDVGTGGEQWRASTSGMIFSVAFSPDGRHIVSGDDGGTIRVFRATSGREILRVDLDAPVRAVGFSPGGKTIVAGTEENFVVLWEMGSGRQLWRKEIGWPVFSVDVSAGGLVAVGGAESRLVVLKESDGTEVWSQKTGGEIRSVRFDASGRLLGAGGGGYQARVFLGESGELLWSASIGSPVRSVAFSTGGRKLLVGSADYTVRLFEVDEGDRVVAAYWSYGRLYVERDRASWIFR
jgi:outer membrane protein assembly factor BamB